MAIVRDLVEIANLQARLDELDLGGNIGAIKEIRQDLLSLIDIVKDLSTDLETAESGSGTAVNYSTTPHLTGAAWIDGRPVWRAVVEIGAMPGAEDFRGVTFDDGTGGAVDQVISLQCFAYQNSGAVIHARPLGQRETEVGANASETGYEVSINTTTGAGTFIIEKQGFWVNFGNVVGVVEYVRVAA